MQKGIFVFYGYLMPMKKRFELIKKAGFDSVMIWWGDGTGAFEGDKFTYRPLAEKYDLSICNAHLPFDDCNNLWLDTSVGDEYADIICKQITECGKFQIPTVVMHLTRGFTPPPYNKAGLERLKKIVDVAESHNVNLALENLRFIEYIDFVFQNINSSNMGFCFDSGHDNYFTHDMDVLNKYKQHLFALHLNDNMGDADIHMLPFDGTSNWDRIIKTLKEIKYNGILSLEVQQDRHVKYHGLSPENYLAMAFERAVRIEQGLML